MSKKNLPQLKSLSGDLGNDGESSSGSSASKHEDEEGEDQTSDKQRIARGSSKVHINREEYLQAVKDLSHERSHLLIKNNILHRRIAEYYKKRKLDNALKSMEFSLDLEEKYQLKLFAYEELKENGETETETIRLKINEISIQYESQEEAAMAKFKALQDHERNTGTGLIYAMKGKPISDKTIQRFLSLQKSKMKIASAMMLRYIRARNAVMEQENIIRQLEKVGPGLYVAAYEQLRVDQLNYTNKIEEREDELIRNRTKCTEHNQILAHIREKMSHTTQVIDITECDYGDAEILFKKAREDLNIVKTRRDRLRNAAEVELKKAGLLNKKLLLRDFQDAIDTVEKLRDRKAYLQRQIAKNDMELRNVRKSLIHGDEEQTDDNSLIF